MLHLHPICDLYDFSLSFCYYFIWLKDYDCYWRSQNLQSRHESFNENSLSSGIPGENHESVIDLKLSDSPPIEQSNLNPNMNIDLAGALLTLRIQCEFTQTNCKEGVSDVNDHYRTPIICYRILANQEL